MEIENYIVIIAAILAIFLFARFAKRCESGESDSVMCFMFIELGKKTNAIEYYVVDTDEEEDEDDWFFYE